MALVKMSSLLEQAEKQKRGVGSFSVSNMAMVRGVIRAAEELNTPVIMQVAEVRLPYSPLAIFGPMMIAAAENAKVDVAVHLDHGQTMETLKQALELGFTSVMMDGSRYDLAENIKFSRDAAELAHQYGAVCEAELGLVGGSEDNKSDHGIRYTDPEIAGSFARETEIDALAVAIGNAHGNYPVAPQLAFDVLEKINARTEIPLVLHGGSGITDADFQKAISLGITKVNIATASFNAVVKAAEQYLNVTDKPGFFDMEEAMVQGVYENVKHHINVFNMTDLG